MEYHIGELRRYLSPFSIHRTADDQGNVYRYNDPLLGDIYSAVCKYLNHCKDIISYDHMENIAWYMDGINYGSLTFIIQTKWDGFKIITIYFESEEAENELRI